MLTLFTGVMGGGKTEALINKYNKLIKRKKNCFIVKPDIDNRSKNFIESRVGLKVQADLLINIDYPDILLSKQKELNFDYLFIDEIQFFNESIYYTLMDLSKKVHIYSAGLIYDYNQKYFGYTYKIKQLANKVKVFSPACDMCEYEATHTKKLVMDSNQILIGDKEYSVRCFQHWKL